MHPHQLLLSCCSAALLAHAAAAQDSWPQWRGPDGTGVAPSSSSPPIEWSEEKNIRWKVAIDGQGDGSPIVWQDTVFVLSAKDVGEAVVDEPEAEGQDGGGGRRGRPRGVKPTHEKDFLVLAFDRKTGEERWRDVARTALPHEGTHGDASWASASAVTDGKVLVASFGSNGLYGYSLTGERLWEVDLGDMTTRNGFGEGASPALVDGIVVVPWDHEGPSFVVALDASTGEEKWRRERDEVTSWGTPAIARVDGRTQVIVTGTGRVRAYDLANGEVLWECGGMTTNAIPTPLVDDGVCFVTSGFRGSACIAIDLASASGDVTGGDAVLWSHDRDTPYVPSPVLVRDALYLCKSNSGIVTAIHRATGEVVFGPTRLEGVANVYASLVSAAGRIYIVGRDGTTEVLEHGPEPRSIATNVLDDAFDASPAIVGNELFLRGANFLYCIAE